jgi:phenylalanyl-tRNA synthetase beta chain
MRLAHRTQAAMLFEKGLDPELVAVGMKRGIDLFEELTGGTAEKEILDIYPNPYRPKKVHASLGFIASRLGVIISKGEISKYLQSLGFETKWAKDNLEVIVPSFRANDVSIPEDILEEVARIYGYFNLASRLMEGKLPEPLYSSPFEFEYYLKTLLSGWGAVETYTLSLVAKKETTPGSLRLKNPLGSDSEYLRVSLMPSLVKAANENSGTLEPCHLFEMSNVYLPVKGNLPLEKMTLAGIFANYDYRKAKGIIEALLAKLHIKAEFEVTEANSFLPTRHLVVKTGRKVLGQFGVLTEKGHLYYEFDVEILRKESQPYESYKEIEKYPAQIEDVTFKFPPKTKIGEVISFVKKVTPEVYEVKLSDVYKNSFTLRLWYLNPAKTLTNEEVEKARNKIIKELASKFGAVL